MACLGCNDDSTNISLTGSWFAGSPCVPTDCGGSEISAGCVIYNGPNLECSGVETLDTLEVALQKIDTQICEIVGDYSLYNMNCLPTWWEAAITTQEDFVDAITAYACDIDDRFTTFTAVTYIANQIIIDDRLTALEVPEIICASASVVDTDTLQEVLEKYCVKFGEIDDDLDITGVVWNNCLTVVGTPETLEEGFQLLADQICDVYDLINAGGILPTFNNYGSCIGGSSSDSLIVTIGLIKTRLCLVPTFDNDNLTSACFDIPADDTDLEGLLQNMLDGMDVLQENYVTFDGGDFTVTATDGGDPCAGITVSLATPAAQDRFVAVSAGDASPGTLVTKIVSAAGSIAVTNNANTTLNLELASGDKGDITVSGTGLIWTIDNDVVTFAKMQNITTARLLGRGTAGTGDVEEIILGTGLSFTGTTLNVTASSIPISSLIQAAASNTIDNANYPQTWQWNTLTGNNGLVLTSASTAGSVQGLLYVSMTGAMLLASSATVCGTFYNDHTGTLNTNVGISTSAVGGITNYGIICTGAGGQWGTGLGASIYAVGRMRIDGQIDTHGSTSGIVTIKPAAVAGTWTFTLPPDDGDIDKFLTTNGSGVTSWSYVVTPSSYTPILFNTTNIAASTASVTRYYREGNIVHVFGVVTIDATAAATPSELGMEVPVGSNFANVYDLSGSGAYLDNTALRIIADTTNDRAKFSFTPVTDTNNQYSFYFTYIVI